MKFYNFLRFGEKNNTIVFDLTNKQKEELVNGITSMDEIYEEFSKDPIGHIERAKKRGLEHQIGIIGLIAGDPDSSNGVGKSSIMEGICYAHYEKIVRKTANNDKIEKAGLAVVTKLDGKYPKDLKESYVEEFMEDNGSIYRIKRGRTFTKNQKSSSPILEFECIKKNEIDKRGSHRKADTADAIADVITSDYDVFVNSQMFGQNDAGKYLTGTDKTKKEMLISLLRLENVVVGCLELLRKKKNSQDKEVNSIKSKIDFIEDMFCKSYAKYNEQKDMPFEDSMPQQIIETLVDLKNKGLDRIKKCDEKRDEIRLRIDKLSQSEKLIKVGKIKEEIARTKKERSDKEKDRKQQVEDWEKLKVTAEKELDGINSDILSKESKLKSTQDLVQSTNKQVESFNREEYNKKLETISKAKESKPSVEKTLEEQKYKREELIKSIAGKRMRESEVSKENKILQNQIEHVKDGEDFTCDKCKSKVSKEHIIKEIQQNKDELVQIEKEIKSFEGEKTNIESEMAKVADQLNKIERYVVAEAKILGEIKTNSAIQDNLQNIKKSEADLKKEIKDIRNKAVAATSKVKEYAEKVIKISASFETEFKSINSRLDKMITEFKEAQKEAEDIDNILKEQKETLEKVATIKNQASEKLGFLDREIIHHKQLITDLEQRRKEFKCGTQQLNRYLLLESVYGLDGIQTRIVQKYLPLLNIYIKDFLDILSRGTISVKMEVNNRSKIDMVISGGSADTYEMLSGGEKMIVRLAVDIGMALLAFSRSSQKPEIICLDEIFGPLDNNNTDAVFEMLEKLQDKFSRVLIITHNPAIQAKLRSNIIIEKDSGSLGLSAIKRIE